MNTAFEIVSIPLNKLVACHEVRRVLTHRFPYRIFFSLKGDTVVVHAVSHGHRHDRHWKDRL